MNQKDTGQIIRGLRYAKQIATKPGKDKEETQLVAVLEVE